MCTLAAFSKTYASPDNTPEQLKDLYNKWDQYEKDCDAWGWKAPDTGSEGIIKHVSDKNAYILDVAAGTGMVAEKLKRAGFTNIDALEPSSAMLQKAREKNLYKKYYNEFFDEDVKCIETSTYDILVVTGALTEGHLKLNSFPEMIRCVKPGGLVILTIAEWSLDNVEEFKGKFEPYTDSLQIQGLWERVEKSFVPDYTNECGGYCFVFKVTKTQ